MHEPAVQHWLACVKLRVVSPINTNVHHTHKIPWEAPFTALSMSMSSMPALSKVMVGLSTKCECDDLEVTSCRCSEDFAGHQSASYEGNIFNDQVLTDGLSNCKTCISLSKTIKRHDITAYCSCWQSWQHQEGSQPVGVSVVILEGFRMIEFPVMRAGPIFQGTIPIYEGQLS